MWLNPFGVWACKVGTRCWGLDSNCDVDTHFGDHWAGLRWKEIWVGYQKRKYQHPRLGVGWPWEVAMRSFNMFVQKSTVPYLVRVLRKFDCIPVVPPTNTLSEWWFALLWKRLSLM
jgi:hypothetical protein